MNKLGFHAKVSFVKSGLRIIGISMIIFNIILGGLLMVLVAEIVGILEEFQDL